jgi:thermitase
MSRLNTLLVIFIFIFLTSSFANQLLASENNGDIKAIYPLKLPIGISEVSMLIIKSGKALEGAKVSIHKNDENLDVSGFSEDNGYVGLELERTLSKEGELVIEVSFNDSLVFTAKADVYIKLNSETWFVDANNGSDYYSGKSRDKAFKTITHALMQANGVVGFPDTVIVAPGNYNTTMSADTSEYFPIQMKSYVSVLGDSISGCIIDAQLSNHVVRFQKVTNATLSGFTVTGGNIGSCGGGVYIYNSTGNINNLVIIDNKGKDGGAVCCVSSSPIIHNIIMVSNTTTNNGAGITLANSSSPTITNCTIANNSGPGIYVVDVNTSNPQISDCIIWSNVDDLYNVRAAEISYSDISNGDFNGINNNFSTNPLFLCNYYLSNISTGQPQNSPCINVGSRTAVSAGLDQMTTRIDGAVDSGIVDVGAHYKTPCMDQCFIIITLPTDIILYVDQSCGDTTHQFTGTANECNGSIIWSSSDNNIATVDSNTGLVTAVSPGVATITAQCSTDNLCSSTATVTVVDCCHIDIVPPKDVTLYADALCGNTTYDFDANESNCNGNVQWNSSDSDVARVHPVTGVVTAVNPGTCTITAQCTSNQNCFDEATVTVLSCTTCNMDITDPEEAIIYLNLGCGPINHTFTATSLNCGGGNISWSSSNTAVAIINPNTGNARSVGLGFTYIRAICATDPSCYDETILVVSDCNRGEIDVKPTALYFQSGLDYNNENPTSTSGEPPVNGGSFYHFNSQNDLNLSLSQIVIKFRSDLDSRLKREILSSENDIESYNLDKPMTTENYILVDLTVNLTEVDVNTLIDKLSRNPNIELATPVFKSGNNSMIPMRKMFVKFKQNVMKEVKEKLISDVGASVIETYKYDSDMLVIDSNMTNGFQSLEISELLFNNSDVLFAEPDFLNLLEKLATPNDPLFPNQWNLENTRQQAAFTLDADIDATCAWDINTGGPNVTVAIVDEGVDQTHVDLIANLVPGYDATDNPNGTNPNPADGHGTGCAGIAAGCGNNGIGVSGVGWNMKIMPIRIAYGYNGGWMTYDSWIANGINWAIDHGADVLSNSWGGGGSANVINQAIQHGKFDGRNGKGCVICFASGNSNNGVIYPATLPEVITVGASSPCDQRKRPSSCDGESWWGSCYGLPLDVLSPGVLMYTTDMMGNNGYTSGNYMSNFNGTSSATPGAAGLCTLILSENTNLTSAQVQMILENGADDMVGYVSEDTPGWDQYMGHGRVSACQSLIRTSNWENVRFLTVSNLGTGPLVIYGIHSLNSSAWISAQPQVFTLNPTQSQVVTVAVDDSFAPFATNSDTLQIYSDDSNENPFNIPVTFFNYALLADFGSDVTSGSVPLNVQFIDYSTGTIETWNWNFGDGNSSTLPSPEHTYTTQGTYTVSLTVSGSGRIDTMTKIDSIIVGCGIALNADQLTLYTNLNCGSNQFDINVVSDTCSGNITFSSSNTNIATVNANSGLVTAVSEGFCQIRASCSNDNTCFTLVDVNVDPCPLIITPTPTITGASVNTNTPTQTPTPTLTNTMTLTQTPSKTRTPTLTMTRTKTATPTLTPTRTKTRTPTMTKTKTATPTPTKTLKKTPTRTRTPTPTKTSTNPATIK